MLRDLIFDGSGPYGVSRDAWWALITTGLIGGVVPFLWRRLWTLLEERRWRHLRKHFGVMLSWDHGDLGRVLHGFRLGEKVSDDPFIKIQNEVGLFASVIVSESELAKDVGLYIEAINKLWWWLDWRHSSPESIPAEWKRDQYPQLLSSANKHYEQAIRRLGTDRAFLRTWVIGETGVAAVQGLSAH